MPAEQGPVEDPSQVAGHRFTVLAVPDCPHLPMLLARIAAAGVNSQVVDIVEIATQADAESWSMAGSPTLLIDGVNRWLTPGPPALGCRLELAADVLPSVDQIRVAVASPGLREPQNP